jgi:hypothetical protein
LGRAALGIKLDQVGAGLRLVPLFPVLRTEEAFLRSELETAPRSRKSILRIMPSRHHPCSAAIEYGRGRIQDITAMSADGTATALPPAPAMSVKDVQADVLACQISLSVYEYTA